MKSVIININIEYVFDVNTEAEAIEMAENIELPSNYQEDTFEIVKILDTEE